MEQVTMKIPEAARYLGISEWLLRKLCKQKKVPHLRAGSLYLFRKDSLDRFMDNQEAVSVLNESESYGQLRQVR